jgi:transposase
MGRLSAYAKNRILKLRFKKNKRIIHIVEILRKDDNIKVSRQAVSTFLKKYLETNSIYDKPRTGRKRKLTQEEIQLIGQVTRLNRDITARAIKEYLNLNVSTYTILRATKLFEWNKINPNSNDSKKAAALERQLNGEIIKPARSLSANSGTVGKRLKRKSTTDNAETTNTVQVISMSECDDEDEMNLERSGDDKNSSMNEIETVDLSKLESSQHFRTYQKDQSHHHHHHNSNDLSGIF